MRQPPQTDGNETKSTNTAYVSVEATPTHHLASIAQKASEELQPPAHRVKPVTSGFHITLRYLGPSTPAQLEAIHEACKRAEAALTPFTLRLSRFASHFIHPQNPRDTWIWAGVSGQTIALYEARRQIDQAARLADYHDAMFPLTPHITLAIVRSSQQPPATDVANACRKLGTALLPLEWAVQRIGLMVKTPSLTHWQEYTQHLQNPFLNAKPPHANR